MLKNLFLIAIFIFAFAAFGLAQNKTQVTAPNGQTYKISGIDKLRKNEEIILYTLEYYRKNPTNQSGVDVLVVDNKVTVIQDRAGTVYLQYKPDPGMIKTDQKGYILSAHGTARKWILANFKVGDEVKLGDAPAVATNANGEVAPAASIPCFAGAYYRKAVSSFDTWTGIVGVVKLGTPKVDENRLSEKDKQLLDNFSVYMGGRAGDKEIDAGLTWGFTKDESGNQSKRRNAWRPFWRNETWNNAPAEKHFYWYPGDVVQMAVIVAGPGKLRLVIADATPQPKRVFQTEFDAKSFVPNVPRQFKRVNAIDQFGNEGKPVQPTKAEVTGAEWLQTTLLRGAGADAKQIPMDKTRFTDMRCANESNVVVSVTDAGKGAEKIDIYGTPKK
ncbi:MAG: hypothetical protein LC768_06410 [Acidobacteria bacterium]|nr:hypothetical protein [Acidobacteriota bacterium]MCA1637956.1 hypothetical protein [Acidobacteriota bacterium]